MTNGEKITTLMSLTSVFLFALPLLAVVQISTGSEQVAKTISILLIILGGILARVFYLWRLSKK